MQFWFFNVVHVEAVLSVWTKDAKHFFLRESKRTRRFSIFAAGRTESKLNELFNEIRNFVTADVQNRVRRRFMVDCHAWLKFFCRHVDLEVVVVESVPWR